jgi:hypothetical protein
VAREAFSVSESANENIRENEGKAKEKDADGEALRKRRNEIKRKCKALAEENNKEVKELQYKIEMIRLSQSTMLRVTRVEIDGDRENDEKSVAVRRNGKTVIGLENNDYDQEFRVKLDHYCDNDSGDCVNRSNVSLATLVVSS